MAGRLDDNGKFLDLVYGAAVDPSLWAPVLESFADRVGGWGGAMVLQHQETGAGQGLFTRADPEGANDYFDYYASRNVLLKTADPHRFMRTWTPKILTDEDWLPKSELTRTEYYNDFLRPRDIHSVLMIRLAAQGMEAANISIGRPAHLGQFERGDLEVAKSFHSHMIRAYRLGQQIGVVARLKEAMAEFLDRSPYGLFLLDPEGRLQHANQAGEAMLARAGALGASSGRLIGATPEATRRLQALIAAAAANDGAARTGGSMRLPHPDDAGLLAVTVAPMRREQGLLFEAGPAVLVCVADPTAGVALPEQTLRDLFGLSRAEARVALALFEGRSTREAARDLGLSFFTVRAHLAQIFAKTDTGSQVELARLMMRAVGLAPG